MNEWTVLLKLWTESQDPFFLGSLGDNVFCGDASRGYDMYGKGHISPRGKCIYSPVPTFSWGHGWDLGGNSPLTSFQLSQTIAAPLWDVLHWSFYFMKARQALYTWAVFPALGRFIYIKKILMPWHRFNISILFWELLKGIYPDKTMH